MLEEFLGAQDIDIALLQEVTCQHLALSQRYTQYVNIGTEKLGTAILVKDGILLTDIKCLPSGKGITAKYNGISVINIYAPSGAEKKQDREAFYNNDVPYLLLGHNTDTILAGDFNCVLSSDDATGQRNYSRALDKLVSGFKLQDIGEQTSAATAFTHSTPRGASRIDVIYICNQLSHRKQGTMTVVVAFTDHLAIIAIIYILSLDFKEAFDKITHEYLITIVGMCGFRSCFRQYIHGMCQNNTSSIRINGHATSKIPVYCSVRQGCPLSILLLAMCNDPLIRTLAEILQPIVIGRSGNHPAILAYADDITTILQSPGDIPKIHETLERYGAASGARINLR
jgi:hypothetical protein